MKKSILLCVSFMLVCVSLVSSQVDELFDSTQIDFLIQQDYSQMNFNLNIVGTSFDKQRVPYSDDIMIDLYISDLLEGINVECELIKGKTYPDCIKLELTGLARTMINNFLNQEGIDMTSDTLDLKELSELYNLNIEYDRTVRILKENNDYKVEMEQGFGNLDNFNMNIQDSLNNIIFLIKPTEIINYIFGNTGLDFSNYLVDFDFEPELILDNLELKDGDYIITLKVDNYYKEIPLTLQGIIEPSISQWILSDWTECVDNIQFRHYVDITCDETKTPLSQYCELPPEPCVIDITYSYSDWINISECLDDSYRQLREVTQDDGCGNTQTTFEYKDVVCVTPPIVCIPYWIFEWTECINNTQHRHYTDTNCGETKPSDSQACGVIIEPCTSNWVLSDWSSCSNNIKTKTYTDINCNETKSDITQSCGSTQGSGSSTRSSSSSGRSRTTIERDREPILIVEPKGKEKEPEIIVVTPEPKPQTIKEIEIVIPEEEKDYRLIIIIITSVVVLLIVVSFIIYKLIPKKPDDI